MARIIVYTGKGGVGKTSIAAATAMLAAERGARTLVVSTDIAHSLADSFDRPLGPEPVRIAPRLWGQESDVHHNLRTYWGTIQRYLSSFLRWRGLDPIVAEELTILPGMDELASLLRIVDRHDSGDYDVIIVDAAPTGETIRLLSLPEAARWWLERMLPMQRRATKIAGPVLQRMMGMPIPDETVFDAGEDLFRRLARMHRLLTDPRRSSVRLVLGLEKMVIREAQRSFTYFHLFGYPTDLVIANRVLPPGSGPYFEAWQEAQRAHAVVVEGAFAPVPVRSVPLLGREVVGEPMLRELGQALFRDEDPLAFFYRGRPYRVEAENGGFALSLDLPLATKEEVELHREGDELIVRVGGFRRNLMLPRILVDARTRGAALEDGVLKVHFDRRGEGSDR